MSKNYLIFFIKFLMLCFFATATMKAQTLNDSYVASSALEDQLHKYGATLTSTSATISDSISISANTQTKNNSLRRPISPQQPAWIVHIDTWNWADPQKIIDLIPEDIRPYVIFNISLSVNWSHEQQQWLTVEYGYETAKSWLRTCAENQVWAMIQPASGGQAHLPDYDRTVNYDATLYGEFFREYPNFLGFNYCEQFWGFDQPGFAPTVAERYVHFTSLLELSNKYGGYLVVSWCANQWSAPINPIAMWKNDPDWKEACKKYSENFILFEKYTQQTYLLDVESMVLGAYLGGYSGQFGVRYDETHWTDSDWVSGNDDKDEYTPVTGLAPQLERFMLTGMTMIDGPELIWLECFRELNPAPTTDGYTMRRWDTYPQFDNIYFDMFRKLLDETIRIPTRQEVIDRTKFIMIQDVNSGSNDDKYCSYHNLFEGLYRMDEDGNLSQNSYFYKKTGRYPSIPTAVGLNDELANTFQIPVNQSTIPERWPTIESKVEEFDNYFPEEYTGDIYAGRHENGWVVYNPYKRDQDAEGNIPFKYNTSEAMELTLSRYTSGIVKEYSDKLTFYLNNYDIKVDNSLRTNVIKIYGSNTEPTFEYQDRGTDEQMSSEITSDWSDGVFTLTIRQNGPVDITVNCSGSATGRLTDVTTASVITPESPSIYTGPRQYEAEHWDYQNIDRNVTNGVNRGIANYTGQGYLRFGTSSTAAVRTTVEALRTGTYQLVTKYSVVDEDINTIDLYVNGDKVATTLFEQTETLSDWGYNIQVIELEEGDNVIEFKANSTAPSSLVFDNLVITQGNNNSLYHFDTDEATTEAASPPAQFISALSGTAGVVEYTDENSLTSNMFKAYSAGSENETGVADLDMFNPLARNYSVVWKQYYDTPGANKGVLLRGTGEPGSSPYAEGLKQGYLFTVHNNEDKTVTLTTYIADKEGITEKTSFTTEFEVKPGQPSWFRARAFNDNNFIFECSIDSINWVGATNTLFSDDSYPAGSTQLVWGMGSDNLDWVMDNIAYSSEGVNVSKLSLKGFRYSQGTGPSDIQDFTVSANSQFNDLELLANGGFEVSLNPDEGFDTLIVLQQTDGYIPSNTVHVRMKPGLSIDKFTGNISVNSNDIIVRTIDLEGEVTPQPSFLIYDFENDEATTSATTPPAENASIGHDNNASAGVVSYTDANNQTSNMLTPYTTGQRNATGVVDLNMFPDNATEYSVSWKQCIGSSGTGYKVGVLLRGDSVNMGTDDSGYVQGIRHGYLFIVYNTGSASQFRVYRSTETYNSLNTLVNTEIGDLVPDVGQPVWYRASVSGSENVSLRFEYSLDGVNWNTGTTVTDNTTPAFKAGSTQIVWGLAAADLDFYLDDITFNGLTEDSEELPEFIDVSKRYLSGFNYMQGFGPSDVKSFIVSGDSLNDNIVVNSPVAYEVSLNHSDGFNQSVILPQVDGKVNDTNVYVRMRSDLLHNSYPGDIIVSSPDVAYRIVSLSGIVDPGPEIIPSTSSISDFGYEKEAGPSDSRSFRVSGNLLADDINVISSDHYEISLNSNSGYSSSVTLFQSDSVVTSTRIYVRLKQGLAIGDYYGDVTLTSLGAISQSVSLSGEVVQPTDIPVYTDPDATVVSKTYYTLSGQRVDNIDQMNGIFIVRKIMSDGSVKTERILKTNSLYNR